MLKSAKNLEKPKRKRSKSINPRLSINHTLVSFLAARREELASSEDDDSDVEIVEMPTVIVHLDDSMDSFAADNKPDVTIKSAEKFSTSTNDASSEMQESKEIAVAVSEDNVVIPAEKDVGDTNKTDSTNEAIENKLPETSCEIKQIANDLNISLNEMDNENDANETLKAVDLDTQDVDLDITLTETNDPPGSSKSSYADVVKTAEPQQCIPNETVTITVAKPSSPPTLFFEDHEGSFSQSNVPSIPLYDVISDDSFICDQTPAKHKKPSKPSKKNGKQKMKQTLPKDADDDVEIIFDSPNMPSPKRRHRNLSSNLDDSVVFVSESLSTAPPSIRANVNYISINHAQSVKEKISKIQSQLKKKRLMQRLKKSPVKNIVVPAVKPVQQPTVISSYNPTKPDISTSAKRMIFIDGSNVAFSHSNNQGFSVRGISICLEFFEKQGHVVKAVLPQMRVRHNMSSDPALLEQMHKEGRVIFTPCKNLPGKSSVSYDDRFILDLAVEFDAAIISNDNFRDLLREDETKYRTVIETRVIGFTWCMDMILFPKDPYGRNGPAIEHILIRTVPV